MCRRDRNHHKKVKKGKRDNMAANPIAHDLSQKFETPDANNYKSRLHNMKNQGASYAPLNLYHQGSSSFDQLSNGGFRESQVSPAQ